MNLGQFREQHPEYRDVPDAQLAAGIYRKYYADKMDESEFMQRAGVKDSLADGFIKTLQNFPERMQLAAGGVMQSAEMPLRGVAQFGTDLVEADGPFDKFMAAAKAVPSMLPAMQSLFIGKNPVAEKVAEAGRDMAEGARQELEANQPVGLTGPEQFAVDVARGVQDMGPAIGAGLATRNPGVAAAVMGGQVYGQTYADRRIQGQDPIKAGYAARFHAFAEAIPETIPAIRILRKGSPILRRVIEGGLTEGGQEALTSALTQTYDARQLEGMTLKEAIQGIDWDQVLYEGAVGSAVGGTVSTIVHPITKTNRKKVIENAEEKLEDLRPVWAGLLTRRQLAEVSDEPGIKNYVDLATEMDSDRNQLITESAEIAKRWESDKGGEALADLMHTATLMEVDPSEDYSPKVTREEAIAEIKALRSAMRAEGGRKSPERMERVKILTSQFKNEPQRLEAHKKLREQFDSLPPESQQLFRDVRDAYQDRWASVQLALEQRIQRSKATDNDKRTAILKLRRELERASEFGPYFPLARFGDYWVYGEKDGKPAFSMVESRHDQRELEREMAQRGYSNVKLGKKIETAPSRIAASASFVADISNIITEAGGQGHIADKVKDELWQLYLHSLPDVSIHKNFIHRKKTPGFSRNALRTFANQMFHGAHQLARLRYVDRLEAQLDNLREQAKTQKDSSRITDYINELEKRHEWMLNPTAAPWAQAASQIGFGFYLGLSPAAAAVNLAQTPLVAFPVMASEFGYTKTAAELAKASAQFIEGKGGIESTLNPEELEAFQELVRQGVIDKTLAHNLAELAETEGAILPGATGKVSEVLSFMFHHAERFNREVTSMAAYRLARSKGMTESEAVARARDITYESHFDYSNANRARFMQGNIAKVLLQFKQYAQSMTYLLMRTLYQSTNGDAQTRTQARKKLTGILGAHALAAGLVGMPLFDAVMTALDAAHDLFGDDEPWDAEAAFREWLVEHFGKTGGEMIAKGPVSAMAGVDLSSRVGLSELWWRRPNRELEGRAIWQHALEQVVGPSLGIIPNALTGLELMREGHTARGMEYILPKAARDPLKAYRFHKEGAQTISGAPMVEDLTTGEVVGQAVGFTPERLSERYAENSAERRLVGEAENKRKRILNAYALAVRMNDDEAMKKLDRRIEDFNQGVAETVPSLIIQPKTLYQSLRNREKTREKMDHGNRLPKGFEGLDFAR